MNTGAPCRITGENHSIGERWGNAQSRRGLCKDEAWHHSAHCRPSICEPVPPRVEQATSILRNEERNQDGCLPGLSLSCSSSLLRAHAVSTPDLNNEGALHGRQTVRGSEGEPPCAVGKEPMCQCAWLDGMIVLPDTLFLAACAIDTSGTPALSLCIHRGLLRSSKRSCMMRWARCAPVPTKDHTEEGNLILHLTLNQRKQERADVLRTSHSRLHGLCMRYKREPPGHTWEQNLQESDFPEECWYAQVWALAPIGEEKTIGRSRRGW